MRMRRRQVGHLQVSVRLGRFWSGVGAWVFCAAAVAADPVVGDWESLSVRELMQQDLNRALSDARSGGAALARGGPPVSGAASHAVLAPRLVALYGVGRALMAEVQVGRESYLYVKGQVHPAGYAGDSGVYQLRGMNGACVQLERGEDRHSLCLRMLLGEARP
ncbi:MAG TPA: hypothetical protein VF285_02620 [Castellaniella sp.]|uniref:hypothetical protein n=1 Tax=Castellaniella sp. TaxID=1955812 RepID=UPI002EDBEFFC